MSLVSRITNLFRAEKVRRDLDAEIASHIAEAVAEGRDPEEAQRAFGSILRNREASYDVKVAAWLDSLRADVVFGWRQILKHRVASGAAILSLALAIGACTSAFRLIDALLLRPLPVAHAERLFFLAYEYTDKDGKVETGDSFDYPSFRTLRDAVKGQVDVLAISYNNKLDITYGSDDEIEKAHRQYVSGTAFGAFGLKPAVGRLLTPDDDRKAGAHPYVVLSHDYWRRRFGSDPQVVGRRLKIGTLSFEIVGVLEKGFTGTDTGSMTDIYVPTMMNAQAIEQPNWSWFRTWVQMREDADPEAVRQQLQAKFHASREERAKTWSPGVPKKKLEEFVNSRLRLDPAGAGVSSMQKTYRRAMLILGLLIALVLLIACANVANLMTAQAAARAREMALRVSIGAGRWRLVQLVLVESAQMALIATALGALFAAWAAPFVVGMIGTTSDPARLQLPADWRVLGFGAALAVSVTFLFGLAPALRASGVQPLTVLKGGADPHSRRRMMHALVAAQVAFCFLVHFVAGMFVSSFERLTKQPLGLTPERVLVVAVDLTEGLSMTGWREAAERVKALPGVATASVSSWTLLGGSSWTDDVWVNGEDKNNGETWMLSIGPGWIGTMRIPLLAGRDFREGDLQSTSVLVNQAFADLYFGGQNAIGKYVERRRSKDTRHRLEIVGVVGNVRYRNLREPMRPMAFLPFDSLDAKGNLWKQKNGAILVRTKLDDEAAMAATIRKSLGLRVSSIGSHVDLVRAHTIRERMLAMLSVFFAVVALVLAGVGLYGVLDYSVLQRRREIGIRMALGAKAEDIVWRISAEVLGMLGVGAAVGLALGLTSERYLEALLFQVKSTDLGLLIVPTVTIVTAALLAALPAVIRAVRIDPANSLRAD